MSKRAFGAVAAVLAAVLALPGGEAAAQQEFERAGAQRDWSVFASGEGEERVCWVVTKPKSWRAQRDGRRVEVSRGDVYLMVATRPAQGVDNEVSWVAGYPVQENASVRLDIGSESFALFARGENAWPENPAADARVVEAMKAGAEAVATGVSTRGTTTVDTFSLLGFTAAFDEAQRLCG